MSGLNCWGPPMVVTTISHLLKQHRTLWNSGSGPVWTKQGDKGCDGKLAFCSVQTLTVTPGAEAKQCPQAFLLFPSGPSWSVCSSNQCQVTQQYDSAAVLGEGLQRGARPIQRSPVPVKTPLFLRLFFLLKSTSLLKIWVLFFFLLTEANENPPCIFLVYWMLYHQCCCCWRWVLKIHLFNKAWLLLSIIPAL